MSLPPFDPDDPRLTAYALGETDEADRSAVEAILAGSAEARAEIEKTRAFAHVLAAECARENEQHTASRRNVIPLPQTTPRVWRQIAMPFLQAAAVLALAAPLVYFSARPTRRAASSATAVPPPSTPATLLTEEPAKKNHSEVAAAPAPAAAASAITHPGLAAGSSAPAAPDGALARCTVRVRTADGTFFGGTILSAGGLILSSTPVPGGLLHAPCTVTLADGREFDATVEHSPFGRDWWWLRIKAAGLPAATLATEAPTADTLLTLNHVDWQTGDLRFSRVRPGSGQPETAALVFNAAGELLVMDLPESSDHAARAKAGVRRAASAAPSARPFTAAEREMIRQRVLSGP